jgi:Fe-S-cluster containining protein
LTPYDILRLKSRLNLSSDQFLDRYTDNSIDETYGLPLVMLKMGDDETRRCPFVSPEGCSMYEDRPGACRLYPLGRAASKIGSGARVGEHYFLVKEPHCLGLKEEKEWTIQAWLTDQRMLEYNTMNNFFLEITTTRGLNFLKTLSERQLQMYYTACYNQDTFRHFIFKSTFLERFEIAEDILERIQTEDIELMHFAFRWLKFSVFGEKTIHIKGSFHAQATSG